MSTELQEWLHSFGVDTAALDPETAANWLLLWRHQNARKPHRVLPDWAAGPTVRRPLLAGRYVEGKRLYKGKVPIHGVEGPDGEWIEDAERIEAVLWRGREDIWSKFPDCPPAAEQALTAYFRDRTANFPGSPRPNLEALVGTVLGPSASAPGWDGHPYELYHVGSRFVANLLGQAHYAAEFSDELLLDVLGPSEDLLVWIPKKEGARQGGHFRPLELPTCLQRLFGASIVHQVGAQIEQHLSHHQAAHRGGHCGATFGLPFGT